MNRLASSLLNTAAVTLAIGLPQAAPAAAQSGGDVVVMRRVIAPPNRLAPPAPVPSPTPTPAAAPAPSPTPTPAPPPGTWSYGDWVFRNSNACTTSAPQTRTATCMAGGSEVDAARCEASDAVTRTIERLEGCTRSWHEDASPWSSQCSTAATRTDVWSCLRSDGNVVPDAECSGSGPKPVPVTQGAQYGSCTYRWATTAFVWSNQCSESAVQTRTVTCQRRPSVEGGDASVVADVPDKTLCAGDGPQPEATTPPVQNVSQCQYDWVYTPYGWNGVAGAYSSTCSRQAAQTRTATCWRHEGGTQPVSGKVVTGSDALCSPNPAVSTRTTSQYGYCTNAVTNGDFEGGVSAPWTGVSEVMCGNPGTGAGNGRCYARVLQNSTMRLVFTGLDVGSDYTLVAYGASASNAGNRERMTFAMTSATGVAQSVSHQFLQYADLGASNRWSTVFQATSATMTLSITPTAGGLAKVDGVSLNIVPQ